MTSRDEAPIACTLGGNDYHERLAWIAQLNRDGLRSHRRDVMALEFHYAAAVRDRVHQLVRQEAECCAFLGFAIEESPDQVSVTITVPERASGIADDLLAPFLPSGSAEDEQQAGRCSSGRCWMLPAGEAASGSSRRRVMLNGTTGASRAASVAALTTAAGAVACGVCCVLPFALPAVAAASAGGALAWLGRAHGTMTLIASAIVVAAWISVGAQSRRAQRRPASTTLYAMAIATAVLALAIVWPRIEPYLIDLLRGRP